MAKKLKIGVVLDPWEQIKPEKDTSLVIMEEACMRGHELWCLTDREIFWHDGRLTAQGKRVKASRQKPIFELLEEKQFEVTDFDVVIVRKDPPFDGSYLHLMQLLGMVSDRVRIMNRASSVLRWNEKLAILQFPTLIPPTMVCSSFDQLQLFRDARNNKRVVLKPLNMFGGEGIEFVDANDQNAESKFDRVAAIDTGPIMVQEFLPGVSRGDKRIILINGKPEGAVLRVPAEGRLKANFHMGGMPVLTEITPAELAICEKIGPRLRENGLDLVGLDVIDGLVTEINVTSPTGFQEIERLAGIRLQALFLDYIERELVS